MKNRVFQIDISALKVQEKQAVIEQTSGFCIDRYWGQNGVSCLRVLWRNQEDFHAAFHFPDGCVVTEVTGFDLSEFPFS